MSKKSRGSRIGVILALGLAPSLTSLTARGQENPKAERTACPDSFQVLNDITCIDMNGLRVVYVKSQSAWYKFFPGTMMSGVGIAAPLDQQDQQVYVQAADLALIDGWDPELQSEHDDFRAGQTVTFPSANKVAVFHECPAGSTSHATYAGVCADAKGAGVAFLKATGQSGKVVAANVTDILLDFGEDSPFARNPHWVQAEDLATPSLLAIGRAGTKLRLRCPEGYHASKKLYCTSDKDKSISYLYLAPSALPLRLVKTGGDDQGEVLVEQQDRLMRYWLPVDRFAEIVETN